jgi:hypothetical protein
VITITGAAAAKANPFKPSAAALQALVVQQFEIVFTEEVCPAQLWMEGRVLGLLRSDGQKTGNAELTQATAEVLCDSQPVVSLDVSRKCIVGRDGLAINLVEGPICVPVGPGCHELRAMMRIAASQGPSLLPHVASAEFAQPPALPAAWIHSPDTFSGVDRTSLGFQVSLRVEPLLAAEVISSEK